MNVTQLIKEHILAYSDRLKYEVTSYTEYRDLMQSYLDAISDMSNLYNVNMFEIFEFSQLLCHRVFTKHYNGIT